MIHSDHAPFGAPARARKEVEIQYAMRHPNVVEVVAFDLGGAEHPPCLVMERMQESLYDLLNVEGMAMGLVAKASILRDVSKVCPQSSAPPLVNVLATHDGSRIYLRFSAILCPWNQANNKPSTLCINTHGYGCIRAYLVLSGWSCMLVFIPLTSRTSMQNVVRHSHSTVPTMNNNRNRCAWPC